MILVSTSEMRALERRAVESGTSETELMNEAGSGAARWIHRWALRFPEHFRRRFVVVCGRGNNGGDGLKVATDLLEVFHEQVAVFGVAPVHKMSEASRYHGRRLKVLPAVELEFRPGDMIIDALLGTGVTGALNPPYDEIISKINAARLPVVSLDCPSGLNCDDGSVNPVAVTASTTVTFGWPKIGLTLGDAGRHCGPIRVIPLSIPAPEHGGPAMFTGIDAANFIDMLPHESHKNSRGRVAVIGGSPAYMGAPQLSAIAALRSGAGLVQMAAAPGMNTRLPLAMVLRNVDADFTEAPEIVESSDVAVVGPGWVGPRQEVFRKILELERPLVLDAEALNMIAAEPELLRSRHAGATTVFTPHPGEIRRLQNAFNQNPDTDKTVQALSLAKASGAIVVLKCAKTVVAHPDGRLSVNSSGCPALATAGSGDVLTGVIAAMIGREPPERHFDAVCTAVYLHGLAGELHPSAMRSVIADDMPELVSEALRLVSPLA
ncbi:MAG: NAD(P)H-hydrate dehydratase [Victivallaceae bacterium]|nr:NAD(P)H-hydrate dehydratase [Victivallaceae bacterium]